MKNYKKKGFTALEVLIAISILGILSVIAINTFSLFRSASAIDQAHAEIVGMLHDARSRTLASKDKTTYGVHFEENAAILFAGSSYDPAAATNEVYSLNGVKIIFTNLPAGNSIVFLRLTGEIAAEAALALQSSRDSARAKTIAILASGIIE